MALSSCYSQPSRERHQSARQRDRTGYQCCRLRGCTKEGAPAWIQGVEEDFLVEKLSKMREERNGLGGRGECSMLRDDSCKTLEVNCGELQILKNIEPTEKSQI